MNIGFERDSFLRSVQLALALCLLSVLIVAVTCGYIFLRDAFPARSMPVEKLPPKPIEKLVWTAPDSTKIPLTPEGDEIRYGRELIARTSRYLGPRGSVSRISNGMNCQNCHLKAGAKPFGNNYSAVFSTYPKFRARSGTIETMEKRINDCIERSLNGVKLAEDSREMKAIIAYFKWLGSNVKKGETPHGAGITPPEFLDRPADPLLGKKVYVKHCEVCHGASAEGMKHPDSLEWTYPPLVGANSYTTGAGLFRLSRFAGYVKHNMPNGTSYEKPVLTDEEAWDVAAYVNSLSRPVKVFPEDWPDISGKPFDHPFGPYADTFSVSMHKYGPFGPIVAAAKSRKKN